MKPAIPILISGNAKKGPGFIHVVLDVLEKNQANRLAKNPDRFSQDKLFGKFQKLSAGSVKQEVQGQD
jgi:hypothetical protein